MSADDILNRTYVSWMDAARGPQSDIVISSRIRLARNLRMIPFPHLMDRETGIATLAEIQTAWKNSSNENLRKMNLIAFDKVSALDREILVEKHLISPEHARFDDPYRGVIVDDDGALAIMINEEDHLRIQCLLPGLNLDECYRQAQEIDDQMEQSLDFAFDEHRGYLTSCPTNVGTGMRASVMLHLPGMVMTGQVNHLFHNVSQLGMTVRGLYGEGTEALGNFFQLSNQITLGLTEEDIRNNLNVITQQIIKEERLIRHNLKEELTLQLEDRIGRALGILTHARIVTSQEALALLSDLRLGVDAGIVVDIKPFALNELMVAIRPAHLQKRAGREMDAKSRDVKRAEVIKDILMKK